MKPELENELFTRYPKIFNGSLVGKKIKCSDGWFNLLDELAYQLQDTCDAHPEIPQIQAWEVTKDHCGLRFYAFGGDQYLWKIIEQAEDRSTYTCEKCGNLGKGISVGPYLQCLCEVHAKEVVDEFNPVY